MRACIGPSRRTLPEVCEVAPSDNETFSPFTAQELSGQLQKMANGKAADEVGLNAELLKNCGRPAVEVIAQFFTDIMDPSQEPPDR